MPKNLCLIVWESLYLTGTIFSSVIIILQYLVICGQTEGTPKQKEGLDRANAKIVKKFPGFT